VEPSCGADPLRAAHEDLPLSLSHGRRAISALVVSGGAGFIMHYMGERKSSDPRVDLSRVLSMWVPVMEIRIVRVGMAQPHMFMRMRVRLAGWLAPGMVVLMMLVVDVQVVVR
jgi:hypothetical protein